MFWKNTAREIFPENFSNFAKPFHISLWQFEIFHEGLHDLAICNIHAPHVNVQF